MASKGKKKFRAQWEAFATYLDAEIRKADGPEVPRTFEEAYAIVADKVSGLYKSEAKAIWDVLREIQAKSIVEVGRNLGGSLFLFGCACEHLESVASYDIEEFELTDCKLMGWYRRQGVDCDVFVQDSTKIVVSHDDMFDFVFIDGGHTGEIVRKDIMIWKDHCKYIGFHDFANKGNTNKHKRVFHDVVAEISAAARHYQWEQVGERGRSEIVYKTFAGEKPIRSVSHPEAGRLF